MHLKKTGSYRYYDGQKFMVAALSVKSRVCSEDNSLKKEMVHREQELTTLNEPNKPHGMTTLG